MLTMKSIQISNWFKNIHLNKNWYLMNRKLPKYQMIIKQTFKT